MTALSAGSAGAGWLSLITPAVQVQQATLGTARSAFRPVAHGAAVQPAAVSGVNSPQRRPLQKLGRVGAGLLSQSSHSEMLVSCSGLQSLFKRRYACICFICKSPPAPQILAQIEISYRGVNSGPQEATEDILEAKLLKGCKCAGPKDSVVCSGLTHRCLQGVRSKGQCQEKAKICPSQQPAP